MEYTLEFKLYIMVQEIKDSINRINERSTKIKKDDGDPTILILLMLDINNTILLINNLKNFVESIKESLMPSKYICIAKTMEEKINWFLDNKVYESKSPFDPDFDFIMKPEMGVFKLEK